jgi:hypothetical protein
VLPNAPVDDRTDSNLLNSKELGNINLTDTPRSHAANGPHLRFCQDRQIMSLSSKASVLRRHVGAVVSSGSEKEVLWIEAERNVTAMANNQAVTNRPSE